MFAPLQAVLVRLASCGFPQLEDLNMLLKDQFPPITVQSGMPLRFIPQKQGKQPFAAQYEPRCYLRGEIQTRTNNWHDLFNALVWLVFPKSKAAINARHYHAMTSEKSDESGNRCNRRDMLTLFDESGVLVVCADAELADLLEGFKWKDLFWQRRKLVEEKMGFYLFGHSLYEKAMHPYIGMTGHGLLLIEEVGFFSWPLAQQLIHLDDILAKYLSAPKHCVSSRELTPVPLLGVPGWADENNNPDFYDNGGYFRPGRISSFARI